MNEIIPGFWRVNDEGSFVNYYLWEWDQGVTLIDAGMPGGAASIMDAVLKLGYALHNVKRIYVTHMDVDHAGGLLKLQQATRAEVACHAVEKEFLEHPGRRKPAAFWMRPLGAIISRVPKYRVQPVSPTELLVDGQTTPEGFTVIHTPGHTPGHISLLHKGKRVLITGDALTNFKGKMGPPVALYTPDMPNAQRSIWKLAKKYGDDYDIIAFGHGPVIQQNGGKRVVAYASQIFSTEV